jgi:drug/metabolite transporter (DMT)-like permease
MRAPWTALRDARAEIEAERDERAELIRLRRERIELRAIAGVAVVGLVVMVVRSGPGVMSIGRPVPGAMIVLLVMMLAWFFAGAYARSVHGDAASPEAARAEALRGLMMFPVMLVPGAVVYWFVSGDLHETLTWVAWFAPVMAIGTYVRYRRTVRNVERASHDEPQG